jgi:hypothetical protein
MNFFKTEPVKVITRETVKDELGEITSETESITEVDALVCPKSTQNLSVERPDGDKIVYNIHFKKGFDIPLRNALIEVRGERYRVDGDPQPLTVENCPTPFYLSASVVRCDG